MNISQKERFVTIRIRTTCCESTVLNVALVSLWFEWRANRRKWLPVTILWRYRCAFARFVFCFHRRLAQARSSLTRLTLNVGDHYLSRRRVLGASDIDMRPAWHASSCLRSHANSYHAGCRPILHWLLLLQTLILDEPIKFRYCRCGLPTVDY